jgi:hypothetical protein
MNKSTTSPKLNKVIVVYNDNFFKQIYNIMCREGATMLTDAGGTMWHIDDVANILLKRKVKF